MASKRRRGSTIKRTKTALTGRLYLTTYRRRERLACLLFLYLFAGISDEKRYRGCRVISEPAIRRDAHILYTWVPVVPLPSRLVLFDGDHGNGFILPLALSKCFSFASIPNYTNVCTYVCISLSTVSLLADFFFEKREERNLGFHLKLIHMYI